MKKGSQPTDGGFLTLDSATKEILLQLEPNAEPFIRPFVGGEELLSGKPRFCLWLKEASPAELQRLPEVIRRLENVRQVRLKSPTKSVRDAAMVPYLFTQDRQPAGRYLAIPEVSSESRRYIPANFLDAHIIGSNKLQIITDGRLYHFGIISSEIHMDWVRTVSGRLESRYSYSPAVYNNFPWPSPSPKQTARIEQLAQEVLNARLRYPDSSLAQLYDPLLMPSELLKAHQRLDRAVERCYRPEPFTSDRERVEFLFALYEKLANPLLPATPTARRRRRTA